MTAPPPPSANSSPARRSLLIAAALTGLVMLLLLAWWRLSSPPNNDAPISNREISEADGPARLAALHDFIRALEQQLQALRDGTAAPELCPPGTVQKTPKDKLLLPGVDPVDKPPDPARSRTDDPIVPLTSQALARKLELATALVLTNEGMGTGFFINDRLLITNRHVVEKAHSNMLLLASRSLSTVRRGTVLRVTTDSKPGSPDFALIRLDDGTAPGSLDVATQIDKLESVVAAGYPGLVMISDAGFRRLLSGDLKGAPDLNLTPGAVQSIQDSPAGLPVILHTAVILQGNSGGPLVDACGRAVGINTFIAVDQQQSGRVSFAQSSAALINFIRQVGGNLQSDARVCKRP